MKTIETINQKNAFALLALLAITYASYLAIFYAAQPPLDAHAFRQTQTALTAYWFIHDGFSWAYETPVVGAPWAIPFEFPLYQALVSALSRGIGAPLDMVGRMVSYVFLLATLYPVWSITKKLKLDKSIFYIFSALLFSSPIYIYWGRTFMIETMALFLAVVAIKYFVDAIVDGFNKKIAVLFALFMTLSILQKVTTAFPVLFVIGLCYLIFEINEWKAVGGIAWRRILSIGLVCFLMPLIIGYVWVVFADHIKMMNPVGKQLTSSALSEWNWGSIEQRYSSRLFLDVIWGRIFTGNLGGVVGLCLISAGFFYRNKFQLKNVVIVSLIMGMMPLIMFSNLHIIHDYYQSANTIFILFALAVSLGGWVLPRFGSMTAVLLLLLIMVSNYVALCSGYLPFIKRHFSKENRNIAIGEILKREVPVGGQFVAFGNDWNSAMAYIAERKSFTVPSWFKGYDRALENPEQYIDEEKFGAIVLCARTTSEISGFFKIASEHSWKVGETHGCLIATPQMKALPSTLDVQDCLGSIDEAKYLHSNIGTMLSVSGWSMMHDDNSKLPEKVYIVIEDSAANKSYFETLKVPRLDVNRYLSLDESGDVGFSALIPTTLVSGEYRVNIVQLSDGEAEACQYNKRLVVNE